MARFLLPVATDWSLLAMWQQKGLCPERTIPWNTNSCSTEASHGSAEHPTRDGGTRLGRFGPEGEGVVWHPRDCARFAEFPSDGGSARLPLRGHQVRRTSHGAVDRQERR